MYKKQDMLLNCRHFIEPNVDFAKQTCSPSPSVTGAQCDLAMALIFTVLIQYHYILTHVYKLLHYIGKLKIQVSITIGVVPGSLSDHTRKLVKYQSRKLTSYTGKSKIILNV